MLIPLHYANCCRFNHKTAAEDVHFTLVPIDYSTDIDNPEASYSDEECNTRSCSDISDCVHSEADTGLSQSLNGNDNDDIKGTCFSSAGSSSEVLEMILVKDVKEGSEVRKVCSDSCLHHKLVVC